MAGSRYLAVDLGAESGRVMVGTLEGGRVALEEVHRFPNAPARTPDGLHWDVLRLYNDILSGLRAAVARHGRAFAGVGVDSWAVDYGLLDAGGRLLGNPYHYRDSRTDGLREAVARVISPAEQFARTGIAQLPFNTIYQLAAQRADGDRTLELATSLLMIPDLLHYWLSGELSAEYTNATSTGLLGVDGAWAHDFLERLGVPAGMLLTPLQPGSVAGQVRQAVREECGLGDVPVILPATHDTASAVVAVPAGLASGDETHAYISSGTWSLLGLTLSAPVTSEEARLAGFTNEGGVGGTYRFLTNIMGLWLVQECRRAWARAGFSYSYEELTHGAMSQPAPGVALDVDDPAFLHPADMPAAVADQLRLGGQTAPTEPLAITRLILESLALRYRERLREAERLTGRRVGAVHIVGGGARNAALCQLTADACGRPVLAGPAEATALGNVLAQALGRGEIADLAAARAVARASADVRTYQPGAGGYWDDLEGRLTAARAARGDIAGW